MTTRALILAAVSASALALLLAGCSAPEATSSPTPTTSIQPDALVGTWTVDETSDTPEQPYASFEQDNSWTASNGCTRVRGTWQLGPDGGLVVTAGPQSTAECAGADLPTAVADATSATVAGDRLILLGAGEPTELVRSTDSAVGPRGLPIGYWAEGSTSTSPFLALSADGSVSGSDGCNRLVGSWSVEDDDEIVFSDLASTLMACEGVETWLNGAATARVQDGVMSVLSADGTVLGELQGL